MDERRQAAEEAAALAGRRSGPTRIASALLAAALLSSLAGCAVVYREANKAYVELMATFSPDDVTVELRRSFVEKLRNRVTMTVDFEVRQADARPHPAFADGDLHFAGRSPQVQLPVVGEIINAVSEPRAVRLVEEAKDSGTPLPVTGVWRIWPEHAGDTDEKQGTDPPPPGSTNPDHVFEIHPVTAIGNVSVLDSFHPVEGFAPNEASTVIPALEKVPCRIREKHGRVLVTTSKGLFNDLSFTMRIDAGRQHVVADGRFVTADVLDDGGHVLSRRRRMVFVRGTAPERAVRALGRGGRLHVYGIPRVDLSAIWRRLREGGREPALLERPLPYEIIILGVYPR